MSKTSKEQPINLCVECRAGIMQPRDITYFTWLGQELITVPQFPAWVCDVCGRREYDEQAIHWLNIFLDPNAGLPTNNQRRNPVPPRPLTGAHRSRLDS